jgi:hypothetical protein
MLEKERGKGELQMTTGKEAKRTKALRCVKITVSVRYEDDEGVPGCEATFHASGGLGGPKLALGPQGHNWFHVYENESASYVTVTNQDLGLVATSKLGDNLVEPQTVDFKLQRCSEPSS